ncbi:phosphate metabolism protein 7 [Vermiconidia calcicola]|uniref:Phosphate metabolism protein 7 n=1 Tax=Vermiconidia calcicola TaxID=1690605 RepID=A0ACC3MCX3_9PEZI|nr:phosphate metabolism protein 7 [Vermiconidia calcicola]
MEMDTFNLTGSHRNSQGSSLSALFSTLIPIFIISSIVLIIFLILQKKLHRVYRPRTYLGSLHKDEQSPQQSSGALQWTKELRQLADEFVLGHSSIDNYLWLRFFKMLTIMCFAGCCITWVILFPINATGGAGQSGLDVLSFSNTNPGARYFAHAITAWLFLGFVMFLITREAMYYVQLRQAYFLSPFMTSRVSSKSVLFVDVPESYRNEAYLRHIFPDVRTVWLVNDPEDLEDLVEARDNAATKLEQGEVKMIQSHLKAEAKAGKSDPAESRSSHGSIIHVDDKHRPSHKLKPLIGKKVDTVNWGRSELHRLIPEVAQNQSNYLAGQTMSSSACFIEFTSVRAAQVAFKQVSHQHPFHMTPKEVNMAPDDVIWKNIGKPWWLVGLMDWAATGFVYFLCLFWTIPVAFVGVLTNVNYLTTEVPFLSFLDAIPSSIMGIITGLLPVILLAVLMALVPIICGLLAKMFEPTQSAVQLKTQSWYFPFQVIQVFLITTFSSGAASVGAQIAQNSTQAPTLLAQNLPKASNFYIAYFILFGLMTAALQLLNVMPLLFVLILGKFIDKTPRKMYNRYTQLGGLGWGSLYPKFTNLGVIALSYSCIAPLILGFATVGFGLLYLAYRYNVFFTLGTQVSTGGRSYMRALQQLTVGIYLSEICLIGLFAIGTSSAGICVGPLILMIIFLLGTIMWHYQMQSALHKLSVTLPADLLAEEYQDLHAEGHAEKGRHTNGSTHVNGSTYVNGATTDSYQIPQPQTASTPEKPTGLMGRTKTFFAPTKFSNAAALSKFTLSPHLSEPVRPYTQQERRDAYIHPAALAECPTIWLARDKLGLSRQEIEQSRREVGEGLKITDDGAWFDEKNKVQWDEGNVRGMPIWEESVVY